MFWPSMMTLRAKYVPEQQRSTIINVFRIPLNLFVCLILWKVGGAGGPAASACMQHMPPFVRYTLNPPALCAQFPKPRHTASPAPAPSQPDRAAGAAHTVLTIVDVVLLLYCCCCRSATSRWASFLASAASSLQQRQVGGGVGSRQQSEGWGLCIRSALRTRPCFLQTRPCCLRSSLSCLARLLLARNHQAVSGAMRVQSQLARRLAAALFFCSLTCRNSARAARPLLLLLLPPCRGHTGCQWHLRKLNTSSYTLGFVAGSKQHRVQLAKRDSDNTRSHHPHYRVVSLSGSAPADTYEDSPC
jgi:hypothetical protein